MKVFRYFFAGVLLFLNIFIFYSCKAEDPSFLMGEWNLNRTVKTELFYDKEDPTSVFAHLFMKQKIKYLFNEDGSFSKTISQAFNKIEYIEEYENLFSDEQKQEILNSLKSSDSEYVINGNFSLSSKKIIFEPVNYLKNGTLHDFSSADDDGDSFLKLHVKPAKYSQKDGKLIVEDEIGNKVEFVRNKF